MNVYCVELIFGQDVATWWVLLEEMWRFGGENIA